MKVLLHGICSFPYFFNLLPPLEKDWDWHITIESWRHFSAVPNFPRWNVHYIHSLVNGFFKYPEHRKYPGNLMRTLLADKGEDGQLRTKSVGYQIKNVHAFHDAYCQILLRVKPDIVILPIVESSESVILMETCKEKKVPCYVVTSNRRGRSYFSPGLNEELPSYA